jgi:hypothetical protein
VLLVLQLQLLLDMVLHHKLVNIQFLILQLHLLHHHYLQILAVVNYHLHLLQRQLNIVLF